MKLIRSWQPLALQAGRKRNNQSRGVLTIGNFDGMHQGHRTILTSVIEKARDQGLLSQVMLFEPQPLEFFAPDKAPARLMTCREKLEVLQSLDIDEVYCPHFNREFANLSAEDFVSKLLVDACGVSEVIVGDDFCFGRQRAGNFHFLAQAGKAQGFKVTRTDSVLSGSDRISSTFIRQLLEQDQFEHAGKLLGRPFTFSGRVVRGEQRGRQLGFPTANILLNRKVMPLEGVFAVEVSVGQGTPYYGVANVGSRPTIHQTEPRIWLEVHLFDFSGDLYQQRLVVRVRKKFRSEQKFASLSALQQAIGEDVAKAKAFFAAQS